jgi:anti-sigma factor RsiW
MLPNDLTYQELVGTVSAYMEDMFRAAERASFEAHLAMCESCGTDLDQIQQTIAAVGTLRDDSLSTSDNARLLDLFRNWKQASF